MPRYDRSALRAGVVHLGVGSFHRAHQLSYFDDLANLGVPDWAVVGVGIRNRRLARLLHSQENLFSVVERGSSHSSARVIGALVDHLVLMDSPAAVVDRLADPRTRVVTLTITGDGYRPDNPLGRSVFGVICTALERRRRTGVPPFTVLSCDNLPDNGAASRAAVLAVAGTRRSGLADWIAESVRFPGSMVDRITPAISDTERRRVELEFGISDGCAVVTEPFSQWVIEESFTGGPPPVDRVGARFVDDVAPYKLIKNRMLNGSHCALGYLGSLAGHRRTDEALRNPVLASYLQVLLAREIGPLLPPDVPGMALPSYRESVLERLRNPAVGDPLERLCGRGSTKVPAYLLPSVRAAQEAGAPRALLLLALAAWLRYLRGMTDDGRSFEVADVRAAELQRLDRSGGPRAVLRVTDIFGDLAEHGDDVRAIESLLAELDRRGVTATVRRVLCQH
ncbi:mannitol dehydrogenase family protein [Kribbella swartbergensis]